MTSIEAKRAAVLKQETRHGTPLLLHITHVVLPVLFTFGALAVLFIGSAEKGQH